MNWILNIVLVFALCVLLAGFMIPQILLISFRRNLFDDTNERKIHTSRVPRLGGIAFVPVIFFSMALVLGIDISTGAFRVYEILLRDMGMVSYCFCALLMLYVIGMADDLVGVRYRAKFVAQLICAGMVIAGGLTITNFHGFLYFDQIPELLGLCVTILVIVFVINAVNLIDGIDGLASGLTAVASIVYGMTFFLAQDYISAMLAVGTLGVLVPFFYYNVFGNPAKRKKIFMGDTGSLTIGLLVCIMSLRVLQEPAPANWDSWPNMFVVSFSPLVVPCFDVVRVFFYRLSHGNNPFLPDKNHIHHRLLALGMKPWVAMCVIVATSIAFTAFNVILSYWLNVNLIVLIDIIIWFGGMATVSFYKNK